MRFHLRTLLAVTDFQRDIGLVIVALAIIGSGIFLVLTPAQHLLQFDQKTARWLYEREMKVSGNKQRAIAAAAFFYRLFGCVFVVFGLAILVFAIIPTFLPTSIP